MYLTFRASRLARRMRVAGVVAAISMAPSIGAANDFCPDIYETGVFNLNVNPTFMDIGEFSAPNGNKYDGLIVSSFFNAIKDPSGAPTVGYFDRDQVGIIRGIGYRSEAWWNPNQLEVLTDLDLASPAVPSADGQSNWPNEAAHVPDGILPFEAIIVPEGFHPAGPPGRVTIINMDDPNKQEYIVSQSLQDGSLPCRTPDHPSYSPLNEPRFYHKIVWWDMDGDGLKDAVTVRSGFKVNTTFCLDAAGEVVWFKNPGGAIDPNVEWQEFVIAGFPSETKAADISLDIADLQGDGVPEIVGGNFFAQAAVILYGAPVGDDWTDVDPVTNPALKATLTNSQGPIFAVNFDDLNLDGKLDVLASNHQNDNCFAPTQDVIPGRAFALEQPASGDLFNDPWTTHILKDNIRPNPTFPAPTGRPGRLAPGFAQVFWPSPWDEHFNKPWILLGGDEASKVWLLKPESEDPTNWNYESTTIFDINDYYGPNTSQILTAPAPAVGVSISTIGQPVWRYDRDWAWGSWAEIYIPVFEGRDIHRISFRTGPASKKITCPADVNVACPAP